MTSDKIYDKPSDDKPFRFNDEVAKVFPDMLRRSIPGYDATIEAIGSLAARYVLQDTNCYDLGCSLGAATIAMRQGIDTPGCRIVAVDTAPAMTKRCREILAEDDRQFTPATPVEVLRADIRDIEFKNASMIVLNYTLQFLPMIDRNALMRSIYDGLNDGGLLVLSEKVVDEIPEMEELLVDLHREHKQRNDYSALEVSRKRAALDNVLIPETVAAHRSRLAEAGFSHTAVWLRYFNFVSIIAIR
ncbi:MAG: carboxy-S-adenosyl-L-methionine synthase CmoA [Proteobacteria bacterium]|nr:carboxy-S-adenosyl-L-methionine synthase CmoA [Pseudomonadota bacterium]